MRKKIAILLITVASAFALPGCTMLPPSAETGVGPEEYEEIRSTEAAVKENEDLKKELSSLTDESEKIKKDYTELSKNNEELTSRLKEAETKLEIFEGKEVPKFSSENTDSSSIVEYLNNSKSVLEKSIRGIEIIESDSDNSVAFYTIGYGDSFNQLYIWNTGKNEPVSVDGASFGKDGSIRWIDKNYLLIDSGKDEYKIVDAENMKVSKVFSSKTDAYLIPDTSTFLIQKSDTGIFTLYDFISLKEQELELNYKNEYTNFKEDTGNNQFIFTGTHYDEYGTAYSVQAVVDIQKLKEKYGVVTLEQAIENENN
jgi:hypothetical protein